MPMVTVFIGGYQQIHKDTFIAVRQACTTRKAARAIFRQGKQLRAAGVDSMGGHFINNFLIKK
jgi:hypothetical protein